MKPHSPETVHWCRHADPHVEDDEASGDEADEEANEEGGEGRGEEGDGEADEGAPPDVLAGLLLVLHQDPHLGENMDNDGDKNVENENLFQT